MNDNYPYLFVIIMMWISYQFVDFTDFYIFHRLQRWYPYLIGKIDMMSIFSSRHHQPVGRRLLLLFTHRSGSKCTSFEQKILTKFGYSCHIDVLPAENEHILLPILKCHRLRHEPTSFTSCRSCRSNHLTPLGRHGRPSKSFTSVDNSPKIPVLYSRKMFMFWVLEDTGGLIVYIYIIYIYILCIAGWD